MKNKVLQFKKGEIVKEGGGAKRHNSGQTPTQHNRNFQLTSKVKLYVNNQMFKYEHYNKINLWLSTQESDVHIARIIDQGWLT